jgi:hypothetical protein
VDLNALNTSDMNADAVMIRGLANSHRGLNELTLERPLPDQKSGRRLCDRQIILATIEFKFLDKGSSIMLIPCSNMATTYG